MAGWSSTIWTESSGIQTPETDDPAVGFGAVEEPEQVDVERIRELLRLGAWRASRGGPYNAPVVTGEQSADVLILSSAIGSGHMRASAALVRGVSLVQPEITCFIVDFPHQVSPGIERLLQSVHQDRAAVGEIEHLLHDERAELEIVCVAR